MTRQNLWAWSPAVLLVVGAAFTTGVDRQRSMSLRADLATSVPMTVEGFTGEDIEISAQEVRIAGVTEYLMRSFQPAEQETGLAATSFSLYVGYYERQTQGRTIHSPKNCLPGSGWEALQSRQVMLPSPSGPVPVNRYLLQREEQQALVLYWYQGRGRIQANEYIVKAELLRDAALRGRSEEALVRIVVPITSDEESAFELASEVAVEIIPAVDAALPGWGRQASTAPDHQPAS